MKIRWQLWFLVTLLICAFYCIWDTTFAFSRGEKLAQADWTYVEKAGHKSLAGYCSKIGVTGDGKTPQTVTKEVFEPAKNPLICASSLEEAKQSYGLFVQGQSRKASTQMVFMFIGAWLVILLALFGCVAQTPIGSVIPASICLLLKEKIG